ncbi:hypothetical protein GH721_08915 [Kriegella sp. EG-1]|nr:hypothetical protein [Flavobacteriaceae bacterium EG-1]
MPPIYAPYPLNPQIVRNVMDTIRLSKPYDEKQFEYYHLNRNIFNVGAEVN